MKAILCLPLFLAAGLLADEAQDRVLIDKAIDTLNDQAHRAEMFTTDADSHVDFDRLVDLHTARACPGPFGYGGVVGSNETWTRMTTPRVVSGNIRFVTPDVAIVEGASTIEGAVTLARSVPLLFVMKKERSQWRISSVRVLARK